MTRMNGYQIFECPSCKKEHFIEAYGSINTRCLLPDPEVFDSVRTCAHCGEKFDRRDARFLGWLNKDTKPNPVDLEKYGVPHFLKK